MATDCATSRQRKTARPHSARASASRWYVFVVRKTRSRPSAVPISVDGTADTRGRLVAKAAIRYAQAADMTAIGHTPAKIVEYFHVASARIHRRNGGLPVYFVHVACVKSEVNDGSPVMPPDTL